MMPGVVAGFPRSDLRVKTLTVGKSVNNPSYGYAPALFGSISNDQLIWPPGSRIDGLRNSSADSLALFLNIAGVTSGITEADVVAAISGLRIGDQTISIESRYDISIFSSGFSIIWLDPTKPSPVGATVGAQMEVELMYK